MAKRENEKSHPHDVLKLADADDLQKAIAHGSHEFSFKLNGEKHIFKATSDHERDDIYLAFEKAIAEARTSKDQVVQSQGYQDSLKHLGTSNSHHCLVMTCDC